LAAPGSTEVAKEPAATAAREVGNTITLHHLNDMAHYGFITQSELEEVVRKEVDAPVITQIQLKFLRYRTMLMNQQQLTSASSAEPVTALQNSTHPAVQQPLAPALSALQQPSAFPPGFSLMEHPALHQGCLQDHGDCMQAQGMDMSSWVGCEGMGSVAGGHGHVQVAETSPGVNGQPTAVAGILQHNEASYTASQSVAGYIPASAIHLYPVSNAFLVPEVLPERQDASTFVNSTLQPQQRFTTY
jgi:hypothetical protein